MRIENPSVTIISSGGTPSPATITYAKIYNQTQGGLNNLTPTPIDWEPLTFTQSSGAGFIGSLAGIEVPSDGDYMPMCSLFFLGQGNTQHKGLRGNFTINGVSQSLNGQGNLTMTNGVFGSNFSMPDVMTLSAGDVIGLSVFRAGGTANIAAVANTGVLILLKL